MTTGIILAGGASTRMPGDKAFMQVGGLSIIHIQLEALKGLFDEILIVGNRERVEELSRYSDEGVRVVEETVRGKGPLGGVASGLEISGSDENFVLACDMPFVKRVAVSYVVSGLEGYDVAVPETPGGLEPLHAAYRKECLGAIHSQLELGDLKVTGFYRRVSVNVIPFDEITRFDPTGRLLLNVNSPEDMRSAIKSTESTGFDPR